MMSKEPIKTVRIKTNEGMILKDKAFELSLKKGDYIMPPELVHFLIEEFLEDIDVKDGKLVRK